MSTKQRVTITSADVKTIKTGEVVPESVSMAEIQKGTPSMKSVPSLTARQKESIAEAGVPFDVTEVTEQESENGPCWMFEANFGHFKRVFFMPAEPKNAESDVIEALNAQYSAMHDLTVVEGRVIKDCVLEKIPLKKGPNAGKFFYRLGSLEPIDEEIELLVQGLRPL